MFMNDEIIVFTNGCFDLLHDGHMYLLNECSELGDKLVVGINSDESVKRLKGDSRPIQSENERKNNLLALDIVDEVIIFEDDTPYNTIKELNPDILIKGGDYELHEVVGVDIVEEVIIIPLLDGYSTTKLIEKGKADGNTCTRKP